MLREARRVLKPGAPLFTQFLSRVAALRSLLEAAPGAGGIFDWREFLRSGIFRSERLLNSIAWTVCDQANRVCSLDEF